MLSVSCAEVDLKPFQDVKKVFQKNIVTDSQIADAFKELLVKGTNYSVSTLSSNETFLKDPKVTIPFPKDAQKVEKTLRKIGFNSICDEFKSSMNLAAQNAVSEATPLFLEAIKNITFQEVVKLLNGEKDAVTQFLESRTSAQLTSKFEPTINDALKKNNVTKKWFEIKNKYNKLPLVSPVQSDLVNHVSKKAIEGLFTYVAIEEAKIRDNPAERTTDLLRKVFSQND